MARLEPNSEISVLGPTGTAIETTTDENGDWSVTLDVFKSGGGEAAAVELEVPFLGALPFDPGIVRGGDDGVHRIIAEPDGATAVAFDEVVENVLLELEGSSGSNRPNLLDSDEFGLFSLPISLGVDS